MPKQITSDLAVDDMASILFVSEDTGFAPLSFRRKPSAQLAEREVTLRVQQMLAPPSRSRRKIWDFDSNLHCSVIGTCLTNAELRQVIVKLGLKEAAAATEHDLHASGVMLAGKHHEGAKLLHKALDRRHRVAISQFDKAKTAPEVRALWQEAVQRGEIPGAYWAALTHAATNDALVREIFSEVHMLSHLVGAANRADIRRLRQLEAENADLQDKVLARQQRAAARRGRGARKDHSRAEPRIGRQFRAEPSRRSRPRFSSRERRGMDGARRRPQMPSDQVRKPPRADRTATCGSSHRAERRTGRADCGRAA